MIVVLLFVACMLTLFSFAVNRRDWISPSFIFCAAFTFAIAWAAAFAENWGLKLHMNTFWVIAGGMTEYVLVSAAVQWWMRKKSGYRVVRRKQELVYIEIELWKKIAVILIAVVATVATVVYTVRIMSYSMSNAMAAITAYRDASLFAHKTMESLPGWVGILRLLVAGMGNWFVYVLVNNTLVRKKVDFLLLAIVVLCMLSSMTTGSRGDALFMAEAAVAVFVLLKNKQTGFFKSIRFKTLLKILTLGLVLLFTFQWTAVAIGRVADFALADYIAIYCGAEIANLDMFLQEVRPASEIWGGQTFINIVLWLGPYLGIDPSSYSLDLPFRSANGYNLGNVYTTFYPYIYDFGYLGMIILVGLMAMLVQWNYERAKRVQIKRYPSFSILLYSYIFGTVFFSFFSNKFYEYLFSSTFFYTVIIWWLCNYLFCKVHLKIKVSG